MNTRVHKITPDQVINDLLGQPVTTIIDDYLPSKTQEVFNDLHELFIFEDFITIKTPTGREYQIWVEDDEESIFKHDEKILLICLLNENKNAQFFGVGVEIINPEYKNIYIENPTIIELHEHEKTVTTFKRKN